MQPIDHSLRHINFTTGRMAAIVMLLLFMTTGASLAQTVVDFELPLIVNNGLSGEITARLEINDAGETQSVAVPISAFKKLLLAFADEEQIAHWLGAEAPTEALLTIAELQARGLSIEYDPGLLELRVNVRRSGLQTVSIRSRDKPSLEEFYAQSNFASGLSFRLQDQYSHTDTISAPKGLKGLQMDVGGFTNVGGFDGWSLFYDLDYDASRDTKLAREDVTLVKDFYHQGMRLSIGDIRPEVSRFQTAPDLLGISYARDYSSINPFKNLRPSGRSVFTLDNDSEVTFEVNGQVISTEQLPQGTYSIQDFPLITGANEVRVYVDDGAGVVEVANFSTFVDTSLLATGVTNYGLTIGVQRETGGGGERRYDDELALLGFYERGLTEYLTLGGQAEIAADHGLVSGSAIYGFRQGVVALEMAASNKGDHGTGTAATLQYSNRGVTGSKWSFNYNVQSQFRSGNFISLAENKARDERWSVRANTSFSKSGRAYALGAEVVETDGVQQRSLRLSHSRQIAGLSVSLSFQHIDSESSGSDNRFNLSVLKVFGGSRLRGQYVSDKQEWRSDWVSDVAQSVGDISAAITTTRLADRGKLDFRSRYIGSTFESNLQHRASRVKGRVDENSYLTTLNLSGGFGYADGLFAYGRPFNDGFLIVDRHKTLKDKRVSVRRGSAKGVRVAEFKRRSAALIPLNNSYRAELYQFNIDDLPSGYDIGTDVAKVYAGGTAGYRYQLGSDAANTVIGNIHWPDGVPLKLVSGEVIDISTGVASLIFTNRKGRFVAERLRLGRHKLVFGRGGKAFAANLIVEEGDEPGLIIVGNVTLQEQ